MELTQGGFTQYIVIKSNVSTLDDYHSGSTQELSQIYNMNSRNSIFIAGEERTELYMGRGEKPVKIYEVFKYYDLVGTPIKDRPYYYFYFKLKEGFPAISEEQIAESSTDSSTDSSGGSRVRKFSKKTQKNKKYKKSLK